MMDSASVDDGWDLFDFGMDLEADFPLSDGLAKTRGVIKLSFDSKTCVIINPNVAIKSYVTSEATLEPYYVQDAEEWVFSAIFDSPKVMPPVKPQVKPQANKTNARTNPSPSINSKRKQNYVRPQRRAVADVWTTAHASVNKKVLRCFLEAGNNSWREYVGTVEAYLPPYLGEADQLYRVYYCDDGDEEDLDQQEYDEARLRYKLTYGDSNP